MVNDKMPANDFSCDLGDFCIKVCIALEENGLRSGMRLQKAFRGVVHGSASIIPPSVTVCCTVVSVASYRRVLDGALTASVAAVCGTGGARSVKRHTPSSACYGANTGDDGMERNPAGRLPGFPRSAREDVDARRKRHAPTAPGSGRREWV